MRQAWGSQARGWPDLITQLMAGSDLDRHDTAWAMDEVMSGQASPVQLAGFLVALRSKGETVEEIVGLVESMRAHSVPLQIPGPALDIVGTGGDRLNTVNISTMATIVCAGAGARMVKHGGRAASSATGSADVLERLGVRLDLTPAAVAQVWGKAGITFCFAQTFHPAMRHAAAARKELGVSTAFNLLGPLTNPAQPAASAIGVADLRLAPIIAGVLASQGRTAVVFRGAEGLDELSICGPSTVWLVHEGTVRQGQVTPEDFDLPRHDIAAIQGTDAEANAQVVRDLLAGVPGAVRDAVVLNAGVALATLDIAIDPSLARRPLVESVNVAMARAARSIDDGAAEQALRRWVSATVEVGPTA